MTDLQSYCQKRVRVSTAGVKEASDIYLSRRDLRPD